MAVSSRKILAALCILALVLAVVQADGGYGGGKRGGGYGGGGRRGGGYGGGGRRGGGYGGGGRGGKYGGGKYGEE